MSKFWPHTDFTVFSNVCESYVCSVGARLSAATHVHAYRPKGEIIATIFLLHDLAPLLHRPPSAVHRYIKIARY